MLEAVQHGVHVVEEIADDDDEAAPADALGDVVEHGGDVGIAARTHALQRLDDRAEVAGVAARRNETAHGGIIRDQAPTWSPCLSMSNASAAATAAA